MKKGIVKVTTSWDDGHVLDVRLAELLRKYDIKGTFYMAPQNRELKATERLKDSQIKQLAKDFEIGSHTMTHPVLTSLTLKQVASELSISKDYLAELTGQQITSFCYPRGIYSPAVAAAVKDAGYQYARTVKRFNVERAFATFEAPTALEAHRGPLQALPYDLATLTMLNRGNLLATLRSLDWEVQAKLLFDQAVAAGGIFHFWGHSWVVDRFDDWDKLDRVLAHISGRLDVDYCTNNQLRKRM